MNSHRKQQRKVNAFTNSRWAAYAAAAVASSFAAAHSAEATIHYSGLINQKIGNRDTEFFPLGDDGNLVLVQEPYKQGSVRSSSSAPPFVMPAALFRPVSTVDCF
jgi:hypothetical protein